MGTCGDSVSSIPLLSFHELNKYILDALNCSKLHKNSVQFYNNSTTYLGKDSNWLKKKRSANILLVARVLLSSRVPPQIISLIYFCHAGFHLIMLHCTMSSAYKSRLYTKTQVLCAKEKRQGGPFSTLSFSAGLCIPKDGPLLCLGMLPKS